MQLSIGIKVTYEDQEYGNKELQGIVAAINLPAPWEGFVRIITNGMVSYTPLSTIIKVHGWN